MESALELLFGDLNNAIEAMFNDSKSILDLEISLKMVKEVSPKQKVPEASMLLRLADTCAIKTILLASLPQNKFSLNAFYEKKRIRT